MDQFISKKTNVFLPPARPFPRSLKLCFSPLFPRFPSSFNNKPLTWGMQGLPFDDAEFPPPVSVGNSSWIQSPRIPIVPQNAPHPAPVTDEELYRLVGAPPPESTASPDELMRYSQQMSLAAAQQLQSFPPQSQPQPTHARQRQDIHYRSIPLAAQLHQSQQLSHPARPPANATAASIQQQVTASPLIANFPRTGRRSSISQSPQQQLHTSRPVGSQNRMQMPVVRGEGASSSQAGPQGQVHLSQQGVMVGMTAAPSAVSPGGTSPLGMQDRESGKRVKRSAVEEARIRAQREAETFANNRRDSTKRETCLQSGVTSADVGMGEITSNMRQPSKRMRVEAEPNSSNENQSSRRWAGSGEDDGKKEDESEAEKKERYKRRLDMNRESAAVSRVRRRAYVKELEERLAAVEAEKLQLEGKLEIMQSQNEGWRKQFEKLFLMVASGRRPTYPGPGSGQGGTQEPTGSTSRGGER